MPRPSVIPTVKVALEDYLERMQAAFLAAPDGQRTPTLTANDGKLGEQHLRDFQDNEKTIPTVLTSG
jgi:hypothetical protein